MATLYRDQTRHFLISAALMLSLFALLTLAGWLISGVFGVLISTLFVGYLFFFAPRLPMNLTMKAAGAVPLGEREAPALFAMVRELAGKAGLSQLPRLYLLPGTQRNAFAAGSAPHFGLTLTEGLLRVLNRAQLRAVVAHEISHMVHRDTEVLTAAGVISRLTASMAGFGWFMLLLALPMALFAQVTVPYGVIFTLIGVPLLSELLVRGLSRTREFDADLGAAKLTGDPLALAEALRLLEQRPRSLWQRLMGSVQPRRKTAWLDTHPATVERITRLKTYARAMKEPNQPAQTIGMSRVYLARPRWAEFGVFSDKPAVGGR